MFFLFLTVTNRRVVKVVEHYAFLSTDIFEIKKVKDMHVVRTIMGEKLDFGDIVITSDTEKVVFNGVSHPYDEMKKIIGVI